ncbi:hypothetical protein LCGC14_1414540 [marine sediment metagenome]|uniref:Uncharacterized protein n=1 Tax=marine sediment metagenome TaxID=412755 RepID=A0A0F9M8P8_9ZZZZ
MADDYHGDVWYDVWRSGGNPDLVDDDRVEDMRYDDYTPEEAARLEYRRIYGDNQ